MKVKQLPKKLIIFTFFFINIGNIEPVKANLFSEKTAAQITTVTRNQGNNHNNLLAMLLVGGVGFTLGLSSPFFPFRRASTKTNKKLIEENSSQAITEKPIKVYSNHKETSPCILYIEKAYNKFAQGDIDGALKNFNNAIRTHPNNAKLYSERAYFRKNKLGDKEGAIADYTQAINMNPENPLFYFCRSQTYLELGDRHKAIEDYNTAMDIAPENMIYDSAYKKELKSGIN
ncbi:MAG: tetratricopeptide repeat protein [Nostocales cyanobacterium 94392]|nr:tetratricopeptide repeat protein [Nostocales cyanobacterium 94392]